MTFKEKLTLEHPEKLNNYCYNNIEGCPSEYGYSLGEEFCPASNCVDCWNREITEENIINKIKKEVRKMNKFTLENTIIILKNKYSDEYGNKKEYVNNFISPNMDLELPENAFIEDIKNAMIEKVANTILKNYLYSAKREKQKEEIKKIISLHIGVQLQWLKDEHFLSIEFRDLDFIK